MTNNITEFSNREALLKANSALIGQLQARLKAKRFKANEADGIKLGYVRALVAALLAMNTILKDTELDEFKKRLEALENSQTKAGNNAYTPVFGADE